MFQIKSSYHTYHIKLSISKVHIKCIIAWGSYQRVHSKEFISKGPYNMNYSKGSNHGIIAKIQMLESVRVHEKPVRRSEYLYLNQKQTKEKVTRTNTK